jgi:hypothetical protein
MTTLTRGLTHPFWSAVLLAAVALAPAPAHAQLGRLRDAARRVTGQAVDRAADAAARRAGAAAEGVIGSPAAGSPAAPADEPAAPTEADVAAYAASAPAAGSAVLFASNFSTDVLGDFPAGFSLGSGTFEVANVRGRKVLRASAFGQIHVELPDDLPDAFTLEFEMAAPNGWGQSVRFQNSPVTYVTLAPSQGGLSGRTNAVSQPASNPGPHRFFPVRIVVDGERVKVYHSRTLVANVPEAELGRSNRLTFDISASQADPVLLSNIRLTAGSPVGGGGNPNYPGPTSGGSPTGGGSTPGYPDTTPVNGGRFDARSVGAMDVELAGPATYDRTDYDQVDLFTITLRSEVDPEHYVELQLTTDAPEATSYTIYVPPRRPGRTPGIDLNRPDHVAGARARVGVGSAVRTFRAGGGYVMLDEVSPGRLRGRFQFTGSTAEGEGATFSGTFDARQPLADVAVPNLTGSMSQTAITTRLADARWAFDDHVYYTGIGELDRFNDQTGNPNGGYFPRRSMQELQRTPNGGFVIQPGYYALDAESYSLSVGAYSPIEGQGYLYAPLAGPAEDAVVTVVRNSVNHPEIPQHDVQRLLWAIVSGLRFDDFPTALKAVSGRLLTPRQLAQIGRCPDLMTGCTYTPTPNGTPGGRAVALAESRLRTLLTDPAATFEELQAAAVRAGDEMGAGSQALTRAQWSEHPAGYWVRYLPQNVGRTTIELYVIQGSPAVGQEFDPAVHVAVPGNSAGQRLLMSARPVQ